MKGEERDDVPLLPPQDSTKSRKCHPALIGLIVIGCVLLVGGVFCVVYFALTVPKLDYGVIIDAGSSGSRIYVYKWPHRKDHSTIPVVTPLTPDNQLAIHQVRSFNKEVQGKDKITPGIATLDPSQVKGYLQDLLDYANDCVPSGDRGRTPIFLFATAGMRLLENETKKEAILQAVRDTFSESPYNFADKDERVRIISGAQEGVYGWVTVNYLKNILFNDDAKNHTFGALDLGGASLQNTFLPTEAPKADENVLPLPNNVFELYAHSYLRFGQDQTLMNIIQIVVDELNETGTVPDDIPFPCFLDGYNETLTLNDHNYTLYGTGDFDDCSEHEIKFMNLTCATPPCHMDGVYQPDLVGDFYAMNGFFFTANFFGFASETEKVQPSKYKEFGLDFCNKTWEQAKSEHPNLDVKFLKVYCLTSSYIYNVLTAGFGFDEDDARIYITGAINGTELNWALGGLIAEASLLPK